MKIEIQGYHERFKEQILAVWEKSVRATHDFLIPEDIDYYKTIVKNIDFSTFPVFCMTEGDVVLGFIGIADSKIEMLFLSPECMGKGYGRRLINYAIHKLGADKVDVNEQDLNAVKFYSKLGFVAYGRTDMDSEGKSYPILKMRLQSNSIEN